MKKIFIIANELHELLKEGFMDKPYVSNKDMFMWHHFQLKTKYFLYILAQYFCSFMAN